MSNAFRTPFLDVFRNLASPIVSPGPDRVFSLRRRRVSLLNVFRATKLKRNLSASSRSNDAKGVGNSVQSLMDLIGILDPKVIGSGVWFRTWSRLLRRNIRDYISKRSLSCDLLDSALVSNSSFTCPLEVTVMRHPESERDSLDNAVAKFRRSAAALLLKFPKLYFHPSDVRGLSFQKSRLESHYPSKWGQYEIRCDHNGRQFVGFIHNRDSREKILRHHYKVYDEEYLDAVVELLRQRRAFSNQLGFSSWTEMQNVMNAIGDCESDSSEFLHSVYQEGLPRIKILLSRMRNVPLDVGNHIPGKIKCNCIDEEFVLTQMRNPTKLSNPKAFELERTMEKLLKVISSLFRVEVEQMQTSLLLHGWHKSVCVYRITSTDTPKYSPGYIYLDLFRRPLSTLSGAGAHCSVLEPSDRHVRIYMGLQPPYRSDVTFKKERFLTYEEITAIMHELGHAIHIVLRPPGSPLSQLPLHIREAVSVFCELYSLTDECINSISGKTVSPDDVRILKRDEYFYVDIIRNIAVMDAIHSTKFDPMKHGTAELVALSKEAFQRFSPVPPADFMNPLGGELINYLADGESRIGYIEAYIRASSIISEGPLRDCSNQVTRIIQSPFPPTASPAMESRRNGNVKAHLPIEERSGDNRSRSETMWNSCTGSGMSRRK